MQLCTCFMKLMLCCQFKDAQFLAAINKSRFMITCLCVDKAQVPVLSVCVSVGCRWRCKSAYGPTTVSMLCCFFYLTPFSKTAQRPRIRCIP